MTESILITREFFDRCRRGEREALRVIFQQHVAQVAAVIHQEAFPKTQGEWVGSLRSEWLDLIHEVFVVAFLRLAQKPYEKVRNIEADLLALTRNVVSDRLRKQALDTIIPDFDSQTVALAKQYLEGMSLPFKTFHQWRYLRGCSQIETATALHMSRRKVRALETHLRRGLRYSLRTQISPSLTISRQIRMNQETLDGLLSDKHLSGPEQERLFRSVLITLAIKQGRLPKPLYYLKLSLSVALLIVFFGAVGLLLMKW